jgi:hypothetical protein
MRRIAARGATLLALALLLALGSCQVQRHGPDHGIYCALGKSADGYDIFCPKPKLNGGWPAPYLFDRPGISVEGALFAVEDDFRWEPFLADVGFYLALLLVGRALLRRIRPRAAARARS